MPPTPLHPSNRRVAVTLSHCRALRYKPWILSRFLGDILSDLAAAQSNLRLRIWGKKKTAFEQRRLS
jgi:hypothetical protein